MSHNNYRDRDTIIMAKARAIASQASYINQLPSALFYLVLSFLNCKELPAIARVCMAWNISANKDLVWVTAISQYIVNNNFPVDSSKQILKTLSTGNLKLFARNSLRLENGTELKKLEMKLQSSQTGQKNINNTLISFCSLPGSVLIHGFFSYTSNALHKKEITNIEERIILIKNTKKSEKTLESEILEPALTSKNLLVKMRRL